MFLFKKLADCLQSAFFVKIRSVLIPACVIVNNDVTIWDYDARVHGLRVE